MKGNYTYSYIIDRLVLRRIRKPVPSSNEILHEFQRYLILLAILLTSISFILDSLQQLSAFNWIAGKNNETYLIYIVNKHFGVLLNILIIGIFVYLIYLLSRNRIKVRLATLWYAVLVCLNIAIPYFWLIQNLNAIQGYLWRDMTLFTAMLFVVSTCTSGKYVFYVTLYAVVLCIAVALFSENPFLRENIPLMVFILVAFSFALWKKDILLQKIVKRQSEEKQKIEELSLFKEKMNYMLFHDIKAPLNSIIRQANTLSKDTYAPQISLQAERVKRMLSNMIDIASSSDARLELSTTRFHLSELLQKIAKVSLYNINTRNIAIEYQNDDLDFELFGDRDLIERTLINVIENAVKYSPDDGKVVILATVRNEWITIRIKDQGPGIKEEEKDKIFHLFYSSDPSPDAKKSSGIGLAFCKLVAEAHGGTIRVHSPEAGGSEFIFKLPIVKVETASDPTTGKEVNGKFSLETRNSLSYLLQDLKQLNYYQTSEIYSLLNSLNLKADVRNDELEEIMKKALSCNPDKYSDLITQLS